MATATNTIQGSSPKGYDGKTLTPLTQGSLGTSTNVGTNNLNMGSFVVPPTSNVITSDSMKPVSPVPLADNTVSPNSYTSAINQTVTDLTNSVNTAQKNVDTLNTQGKADSKAISDLQSLLGGKVADTAKTYNETGVTTIYNQLADLNAQATGLKNESLAIPIQIQNEFKGTGATDAGVKPIETSRLRDNALKALSLGQQAAIASAQYDKAKNYADQIIESKYAQIEADIKAKQTNLQALRDFDLTPAQNKLLKVQEEKLNAEAKQLETAKETEKNINNLLIEAQKNSAPASVISAIKNSKSFSEAITNTGSYLNSPETEIVKLGDNQAYLVDKRTGKIVKSFSAGGGTSSGVAVNNSPIKLANGQTTTVGAIADTIIASGKFTKDQATNIRNAINNGEDPTTVIKNNAKNILSAAEQTDLNAAERSLDSMNRLETSLKDFYAAGGSSSLLKGKYENVVNKLGTVVDPALAGLAVQVQLDLQQYRKDISGTAFGIQEASDIASVFPGIQKGEILNNIIVKERKNKLQATVDSTYKSVLGDKGLQAIKQVNQPQNMAKGNLTDGQFVEKSLVAKGYKYTDVVNNTPKGQIPVIDNQTGELGYIPYQEFDSKKYTKA